MEKESIEKSTEKVLQNIVAKRKELGISQWELSEKLNLSNNGYFKVESGKTKLDLKRLLRIAEVLEVSPAIFFENL